MKKMFLFFILIGSIVLIVSKVAYTSFAYEYDIDDSVLFYDSDYDKLGGNILKYLENIDDIILVNSSFLYGDELIDNYDFLVHFGVDYVLNNRENYYDSINKFDKCFYSNKFDELKDTDLYVDLDILYEITDFYFGVRDFVIINDDVCIRDGYISLSKYDDGLFGANIVDVNVYEDNDIIKSLVYYDDNSRYLYSFYVVDNILNIKNVEVVV